MISSGLDPTDPVPDQLLALLDEIDEAGIATVFARRLADHNRRAVLVAWIDTPTWTESREFFQEHRAALDVIEAGDLPLLNSVLTAAPGLRGHPVACGSHAQVIGRCAVEVVSAGRPGRYAAG